MKANELRIGNLIISIYGIKYVTGVNNKGIFVPYGRGHTLISKAWGVPLTEELLLGFGALKNGIYLDFHSLSLLKTKTGRFEVYLDEAWELTTIDYVHEWQNLYYAINKTELTLTDKAE